MALQTSGTISMSDIATEADVPLSTVSLIDLSIDAEFTQPHAMSEFYGWSNVTVVPSDITIRRFTGGAYQYVEITSSSNPQSFSPDYFSIVQSFSVQYYNYAYNYSYYYTASYNFEFESANQNNIQSAVAYFRQYSYPTGENGSPVGSPYLNTNGLPVNLISWT
jgi:hypothetical protein